MIVEVTGYGACCQYCKRFLSMSDTDFKLYAYRINKYKPSKIFSKESQCKSSIVQNAGNRSGWLYDKSDGYKLTCPNCIKILVERGEIEKPEKDAYGNYIFK